MRSSISSLQIVFFKLNVSLMDKKALLLMRDGNTVNTSRYKPIFILEQYYYELATLMGFFCAGATVQIQVQYVLLLA
jgi:hypothetical protein